MTANKRNNRIIIGAIILYVTLAVLGQISSKRKGKKEFAKFYNTEIKGVIESKVTASVSGTYFKINGIRYNFHPYTAEINEHSIFNRTAEIGDSIVKEKMADTLVLIKSGKRYRYTFTKLK